MLRLGGTSTPLRLVMACATRYVARVEASRPSPSAPRSGARASGLRVLVVDDHDFARSGLVSMVRLLGCDVVAEVATAAAAVRAARLAEPDVALVDLDLGDGPTGIDLVHALRRLDSTIGLVVVSSYEDPRLLGDDQQRLPSDAVYVVKRTIDGPGALGRALRQASGIDGAVVVSSPPACVDARLASLSTQQAEILRLVAAGCSNAEIARRRQITEPAVAKAVARLIRHFDLQADHTQNQRVLLVHLYHRLSGGADPSAR